MKTPQFWYAPEGREAAALKPLARAYQAARWLHVKLTRPTLSPLPTICVGGITAGGSGKTPTVHALYRLLSDLEPVILTRGHGGSEEGPLIVTHDDTAAQVGDEAKLHAALARTIVSRRRFAGAELARRQWAKMIIMDDGLQNRSLLAQVNLVVIDGRTGLGNRLPLPAGPLRETPEDVWPRTTAIILIGEDKHNLIPELSVHTPVFTAHMTYDTAHIAKRTKHIAFAGIGIPDKFFSTLRELGINVVGTAPFPDHHVYDAHNIETLLDWARRERAYLITTEKDAVKLPPAVLAKKIMRVLPQKLEFDDPDGLRALLSQYIPGIPPTCPSPLP